MSATGLRDLSICAIGCSELTRVAVNVVGVVSNTGIDRREIVAGNFAASGLPNRHDVKRTCSQPVGDLAF